MADQVKIIIEEKNGVELAQPEEYLLTASNIPYDNSTSNLNATDLKAAVDEISSKSAGFSKRIVTSDIIVAATDEMIVSDFMCIEDNGCIEIDGMVTILGE